ncbi:MAG: hypothetical protein IIZ78_08840 [Clostridiales bacterium]|nr:hypothetical protein [Clostridiales bacterium]
MTEEQFKEAQKLKWNIETMEQNIAEDIKDWATITMSELDEDVVKRWEQVNQAFWTEEIEKAKKKLAEL